jgi:methylmalonyl-CoA mutase cobalamin-binding subunit
MAVRKDGHTFSIATQVKSILADCGFEVCDVGTRVW